MISLNFSTFSVIAFLIYVYSEIFLNIVNSSIFKNKKFEISIFSKKFNNIPFKTEIFNFGIVLNLINLITLKTTIINSFVISIILFYSVLCLIFFSKIKSNVSFINFNLIIFMSLFYFVNNFITFYLFIELYSIFFFFFFLNNNLKRNLTFLEQKNALLLYLFNNFLSSLLYLIGLYYVINIYGTVNILELNYISNRSNWQIYFLIISFFIKLSLPGFHFLKIEVYKYLSLDVVIIYSISTLLINFIFITFLFNQGIVYCLLTNYKILNLIAIFSISFIIQKLKVHTFKEFIAYSGFVTNNLIVLKHIL